MLQLGRLGQVGLGLLLLPLSQLLPLLLLPPLLLLLLPLLLLLLPLRLFLRLPLQLLLRLGAGLQVGQRVRWLQLQVGLPRLELGLGQRGFLQLGRLGELGLVALLLPLLQLLLRPLLLPLLLLPLPLLLLPLPLRQCCEVENTMLYRVFILS